MTEFGSSGRIPSSVASGMTSGSTEGDVSEEQGALGNKKEGKGGNGQPSLQDKLSQGDVTQAGVVSHSEMAQAAAEGTASLGNSKDTGDVEGGSSVGLEGSLTTGGVDGEDGPTTLPEEGDQPMLPLEPALPPVLTPPPMISTPVDLSILLGALQLTEAKQQAENTSAQIKAESKERAAEYDKQMTEVKNKIEDMEKSKTLGLFGKIFKAIGAVIGAIASALTIAAGVLTANPLLVAAGVVGLVMSVDALMSTVSDGKVSISAGIAKGLEAMGVDPEKAQWIAFAIQMIMVVASLAVGFASGGSSAMAAVSNISSAIAKSQKALTVAEAVVSAGTGGLVIGKGVVDSNIKESESKILDIDAVMKGLDQNIELLQNFFKEQVSRLTAMMGTVTDMVEEKSKTMAAIQRGAMS